MKSIFKNPIQVILGTFVFVTIFTLIEHYSGGVATHHLLAREDLPGISNWWGLLTVPLLSWIVVNLISRRKSQTESAAELDEMESGILKNFLAALVFGISVSLLWEFNLEQVLQYFILLPLLVAFVKPVHFPEFLLGFVLGMIYTFGGILPIIIGLVLLITCFLINKIINLLKKLLAKK